MDTTPHADRLSLRLIAAGALMLLAFVPFAWSGSGSTAHPVSGYKKMTGLSNIVQAVPTER